MRPSWACRIKRPAIAGGFADDRAIRHVDNLQLVPPGWITRWLCKNLPDLAYVRGDDGRLSVGFRYCTCIRRYSRGFDRNGYILDSV